jgi:hypothetical protein
MATDLAVPTGTDDPRTTVPSSVGWLLPGLTLLLAVLAVFQLVYLAPRCLHIMQNLGIPQSGGLALILSTVFAVGEWPLLLAALAFGAFAVWQRGSVRRSALLATIALAINLGLFLCILENLFRVAQAASQLAAQVPAS